MTPGFFALGLYQLENLLTARSAFHFFDLRLNPQVVAAPRVQAVLSHARVVRRIDVLNYTKSAAITQDEPIILLCEDARLSTAAANELERAGFRQLYIVEGGLDGLLQEAALSSGSTKYPIR